MEELREAATTIVADLGGHLDWDAHPEPLLANMLTSHNGCVHAAYIDWKGSEIAKVIGSRLAIPWINVRIQEGSLWDYSLYSGESHVDNFSTLPEYWEDDADWIATQRGKPDVLAETWQVEQRGIENYLRAWGFEERDDEAVFHTTLRGKAYPSDQFEYGNIWQATDFLRALGAHDPNVDQPHCVPRHLDVDTKKPWWRFWRR